MIILAETPGIYEYLSRLAQQTGQISGDNTDISNQFMPNFSLRNNVEKLVRHDY